MAGNNNLELEIHSMFIEGSTPEHICTEILSKYSKTDVLSPNEAESISHFFIALGRFDLLFSFYASALRRNALGIFPWGYFAQAVKEQFGDAVRIKHQFCSVFGDTARKITSSWNDKGGYGGFNLHLREVATRFPHIEVHPEIWLKTRPPT